MSNPVPVSVCIIARDCAPALRRCLKSLKPFTRKCDEILVLDTGSRPGDPTPQVASQFGARVEHGPKDLISADLLERAKELFPEDYETLAENSPGGLMVDFARARQIATDRAKHDVQLWIDSDDVLVGAPQLRNLIDEKFAEGQPASIYLDYWYAFDDDGACTTHLWRERVYRRSSGSWKGACHESFILPNDYPAVQCDPNEIRIDHPSGAVGRLSDVRNYLILVNQIEQAADSGSWMDPRWEFYLGNASRGLERWDEAIGWFTRTLRRSGSRDDRYCACTNIAFIYLIKERPWRALDFCWQAHKIWPEEPRTFNLIARAYHDLGNHEMCVFWTEIGKRMPEPPQLGAVDPNWYRHYPLVTEALSFRELGDWDNAIQAAREAYASRPDWPASKALVEDTEGTYHNLQIENAIKGALSCAASEDAAKNIIKSIKPEIRRHFVDLQIESTPPKADIVYICGPTVEPWDASSNTDGIGGSEKMVLMLTREWARAGKRVVVYGNPKPENRYKTVDGVHFRPFQCFNPEFEREVVVLWRSPTLLDLPIKAKKIFVDLHDVQVPHDYTPPRQEKCDGFLAKSVFHAETFAPGCDPRKIIVSRNGVDLSHFDVDDPPERDLKKVVWMSSGDRGVLGALRTWARIHAEFPDASFHVFYGFTPLYSHRAKEAAYQHFWDENGVRHMLDYAEEARQLCDRIPNAHWRGRIPHEDIARELLGSSALWYPTGFPEISCMSVMEAQIAGCIPLISPTAALKETGFAATFCETDDQLITATRGVFAKGHDLDDFRTDMAAQARERFDVKSLAREWLELFDKERPTNDSPGTHQRVPEPNVS